MSIADLILGNGASEADTSAIQVDSDLTNICLIVDNVRYTVNSDGLELGRMPNSEGVIVRDSSVSRRHARFVQNDDGIAVVDLDSTNGTVIIRGDERLTVGFDPIQLKSGDLVLTASDFLLAEVSEDLAS